MSFQKLLADVNAMQEAEEALAKSQSASEGAADDKIAAAAADGADTSTNTDPKPDADPNAAPDTDPDADPDTDPDADPDVLGKSFAFTLEDGTTIEAQDGTELVKSLIARVESTETAAAQVLGATVDLIKSQGARLDSQAEMIKSQAATIKAQGEQIAKLANSGRGRTSLLAVSEKIAATTMAKSQAAADEQPITGREILAKAQAALAAGKISGMDAVRIETSVNQGVPLTAAELAKLA